jgi:MFS family permease
MQRLKWYDHIRINLFWLGLNIRNNAVNSVFMPYLVAILAAPEIRNSALGFMRTAGLIIAMLVQPLIGILSDRSTARFGRRRPFIFVGVLLDLLCLVLIAAAGEYWFLLVAILFFQISSNVSHGALQGLIPDLVPEDQRGVTSGVKSILELLPLILVSLVMGHLVESGNFQLAVVITGVALLAIMLLTMFLVKEQPLRQKPDLPLGPPMLRVLGMLAGIAGGAVAGLLGGGLVGGLVALVVWLLAGPQTALMVLVGLGGLVAMIVAVVAGVWAGSYATLGREVRQHASFTWWVVNRLLFLTAVTSFQAFAPFFLMFAFQVDAKAAAGMNANLVSVVGVFTLLSAVPSGALADRFGYRRLLSLSGAAAGLGAFLLLSTIWLPNLAIIYVAGGILGLATGLFVTLNWALGTRLAPPAQAGRFLGISNLAGAGAGIVGTGLGGPVADYLEKALPGLGYFVLFFAYGILFLLSVASLRGVRAEQAR